MLVAMRALYLRVTFDPNDSTFKIYKIVSFESIEQGLYCYLSSYNGSLESREWFLAMEDLYVRLLLAGYGRLACKS